MILGVDSYKKIFDFINMLKIDSPIYMFKSKEESTKDSWFIAGQDSYSNFYINTGIKWDLEIDSFCINMPNLTFMDSDICISYDAKLNNIIFFNNSVTTNVMVMSYEFYNNINLIETNDLNKISSTLSLESIIYIFKNLGKSILLNSDNFTSGIYIDNTCMFSTDRMSACHYENTIFKDLKDSIVVDGNIIGFLDKINNFNPESFDFYVSAYKKLGIVFSVSNMVFICHKALLNLNYPNFNNIFSKYEFHGTISINKDTLDECLYNILKFDNKCTSIYCSAVVSESIMYISAISNDNSKNITIKIPFSFEEGSFDKNFKVNPLSLKNHLGNDGFVFINLCKEDNKPILIINDEHYKNYIQVLSA